MMQNWLSGAALVCLLATSVGATQCDPRAQDNDRARQLRIAHKLDASEKIVNQVVARYPNDFRAHYTQGLLTLDRSGLDEPRAPDKALVSKGIVQLADAARLLDRLDKSCAGLAREQGWYGIWNTLGADYYNIGDYKNSERALLKAYALRDSLLPATREKLLNNLGLLYYKLRQYDKSARYYDEAGKMGSTGAAQRAATVREIGVFDAKIRTGRKKGGS